MKLIIFHVSAVPSFPGKQATEAEDLGKLSNSNEAAKSELEDRAVGGCYMMLLDNGYQAVLLGLPFQAKLEVERKKTQEAVLGCSEVEGTEGTVTIEGRSCKV